MNISNPPSLETTQRLPVSLKAGWGAGAIGTVTMLIVPNVMLLYFMVGVLGIAPGTAGLILGAVRLVDMFADPAMGILSDRVPTRWGRRRPWMLAGSLLCGAAIISLFWVPKLSGISLAFYMTLMLSFYYIAYTLFTVPYMAMPAEMTDDYDERTSIMSFRTAFSGVAGLIGLALAPYLLKHFGDTAAGFVKMAIIVAVLVTCSMLWAVATTGRARQAPPSPPVPILRNLDVFKNSDFAFLLAAKLFAYFAISANAAVGLLFQVHITGRGPGGLALLGSMQHTMTIVSIPGWLWLARRFEKRTLLVISMAIYGVASLSWLSAGPAESDAIFLLRAFGIGVSYAGIVLITLSMLPDATQSELERTGLRREGVMAGIFAGVEKTAFALAPIATGFLLSFTGYAASTSPAGAQSAQSLDGIRSAAAIVPAIALIAACLLLSGYKLSRAKIDHRGDR